MGNYISCTLVPSMMKNTKATRVIFPTGEVKQYKDNQVMMNAAELMMECPTHFLTNSNSLHIGRRFSPLGADEELECGNLYLFFPMRRLNSVVTAADMAMIFMAANMAAKRISNKDLKSRDHSAEGVVISGINDYDNDGGGVPRLSLEGFEVESGFRNRLGYCRSRKPVLETINEEPIWLR